MSLPHSSHSVNFSEFLSQYRQPPLLVGLPCMAAFLLVATEIQQARESTIYIFLSLFCTSLPGPHGHAQAGEVERAVCQTGSLEMSLADAAFRPPTKFSLSQPPRTPPWSWQSDAGLLPSFLNLDGGPIPSSRQSLEGRGSYWELGSRTLRWGCFPTNWALGPFVSLP